MNKSERFRIELYDENKENDLTLISESGLDIDGLRAYAFSNLRRFNGTVKGYVFDNLKKKKIIAILLPEEIVQRVNSVYGSGVTKLQ
jgi:hypothetical protein